MWSLREAGKWGLSLGSGPIVTDGGFPLWPRPQTRTASLAALVFLFPLAWLLSSCLRSVLPVHTSYLHFLSSVPAWCRVVVLPLQSLRVFILSAVLLREAVVSSRPHSRCPQQPVAFTTHLRCPPCATILSPRNVQDPPPPPAVPDTQLTLTKAASGFNELVHPLHVFPGV